MSNKIKKSIRPVGTTLVLTCLIWIYADQENVVTSTEVVTLLVAPQSGSDLSVDLQDPPTGQLRVTFAGPRADLEELRRTLGQGKFKPTYTVTPEEAHGDTLVKDATEIISSNLRTQFRTITIQDVQPAQVKIFLDPMITVPMPVRVNTGTTKTTIPVVTPNKVKVTMSQSAYQKLYDSDKFLVVDLENELRNKVEDQEINEEFPLPRLVLGQEVATSPSQVKVQLKVQQQSITRLFTISQIKVMGPPDLLARYKVDIRDSQITVALKGPPELINNLKPQNPQNVIAYIQLDADDMHYTSTFLKTVEFRLPDQVKLDTTKMVRLPDVFFKLIDQQAATPTEPK